MNDMKINFTTLVPILLLTCLFVPNATGQDQLQAPSWELGWETDMAGTHDLMMDEEGDIVDVVEFYMDCGYSGPGNFTKKSIYLCVMFHRVQPPSTK